jgi:hypothetical protein
LSKEQLDHYSSLVLLQGKIRLVNPQILDLLQELKERGIKAIALTAMKPGSVGRIPDMVQWRQNQLESLHVDFSHSFPGCDFLLEEFETSPVPVFKAGILCSGKIPKGLALKALLGRLSFRPNRVYFIDDRLDYIASVETELEKEKIPHISLHTSEVMNQVTEFDEKIAEFQWDYLLKHEVWLSDEEAASLLSCPL